MYSEALRIMDENTALYMINELKGEIHYCDDIISQKNDVISQKAAEIQRLREKLAQHENADNLE